MDKDKLDADQQRRDAISKWWESMALRDFIAAKRAALRSHALRNE